MKDKALQVIDNTDSKEGTVLDVKIIPIRDKEGKIGKGLTIGRTLEQNKSFILMAHQGDFKSSPDLGVGFEDILLGSDLLEYRHKIREHFDKDGLKIYSLDLYENKPFSIEAQYE